MLHTRHWNITSSPNAREEVVEGDGVIGFCPMFFSDGTCLDSPPRNRHFLDPESRQTSFTYCSCTHAAPGGSMSGWFTLRPVKVVKKEVGVDFEADRDFPPSFRVDVGEMRFDRVMARGVFA